MSEHLNITNKWHR